MVPRDTHTVWTAQFLRDRVHMNLDHMPLVAGIR